MIISFQYLLHGTASKKKGDDLVNTIPYIGSTENNQNLRLRTIDGKISRIK
jgi:hypothetical protein